MLWEPMCSWHATLHFATCVCDLSTHDSNDIIVSENSNIYWVDKMDSTIALVCLLAGISPCFLYMLPNRSHFCWDGLSLQQQPVTESL